MAQPSDSISTTSDVIGFECLNQYYFAVLKVIEIEERYNALSIRKIRPTKENVNTSMRQGGKCRDRGKTSNRKTGYDII
jgi:hypothetical protein